MHGSGAIRTIIGEYNTKIADHEPAPRNARPRGRPCTIAERSPDARMVGNDMPSAPAQRASYSMAAATATSGTPAEFAACNPEETGAKLNRPPNAQDLAASFTIRARSTRGGAERRRAFPLAWSQASRVAAVIDSGSMPTTNGVDFRRRRGQPPAAATIGDLCATTILVP